MNKLEKAVDLEAAMHLLTLQDLQAIVLSIGLDIQGNTAVLKAKIRRFLQAKRTAEHTPTTTSGGSFPGFPMQPQNISQASFPGEILYPVLE